MPRDKIFVSYSHKDLRHLEKLNEMLGPYLPDLDIWDDRKIPTGGNWEQEIMDALNSAKVAVLLVTSGFMNSDFIRRREFPNILNAQKKDGLQIFWIPVSFAVYAALSNFQAASDPKKPLDTIPLAKRNGVWVEIVEKLVKSANLDHPAEEGQHRVVLLHKEGSATDERIRDLLSAGLAQEGFDVFTYKQISVEILNQLDNHLTRADAVIPLISASSEDSEMLAMHVRAARDKAEKQNGRPLLVPVLIEYGTGVPKVLGSCTSGLAVHWKGKQDDTALLAEVLRKLRGEVPAPQPQSSPVPVRAPVGGGMRVNDPYYIVRDSDKKLLAGLSQGDGTILVKGSRQMGKTSLLARGMRAARENNAKVVITDFQALNVDQLSTLDSLYRSLATSIVDGLELDGVDVDELWKPKKTPNWNLERIVKKEVLSRINTNFVWAMDEVERLFSFGHSDEFFGLLRSWHNSHALAAGTEWDRFTVVIAYATEAELFITNLDASPFNVGTKIRLFDFTIHQLEELNRRHENPLKTDSEIQSFHDVLGGQPFLVGKGLELLRGGLHLTDLLVSADREGGPFADHLRYVLAVLVKNPVLASAVRRFLAEGVLFSEEELNRLRSAGIFLGDSPDTATPRCRLYGDYLKRHLNPMELKQGA